MSITIKPKKVAAALLAGVGWQDVKVGSFEIDQIELTPPGGDPAAEDYGFAYDTPTGTKVMGRMSALLAVRE